MLIRCQSVGFFFADDCPRAGVLSSKRSSRRPHMAIEESVREFVELNIDLGKAYMFVYAWIERFRISARTPARKPSISCLLQPNTRENGPRLSASRPAQRSSAV
jgi:hypothetical protein